MQAEARETVFPGHWGINEPLPAFEELCAFAERFGGYGDLASIEERQGKTSRQPRLLRPIAGNAGFDFRWSTRRPSSVSMSRLRGILANWYTGQVYRREIGQ